MMKVVSHFSFMYNSVLSVKEVNQFRYKVKSTNNGKEIYGFLETLCLVYKVLVR